MLKRIFAVFINAFLLGTFAFTFESVLFWCSAAYAQENGTKLLTKVLQVGSEGSEIGNDDEIVFGRVKHPCTDSEGNIYVADYDFERVYKFSGEGKLVWQYSEIGQGPGEFQTPWLLAFSNNSLYVFDIGNKKIIILDENASYQREFLLAYFLHGMFITENGEIYASGIINKSKIDPLENNLIHVFDLQGVNKGSFGSEIKFEPEDIKDPFRKKILYQYYAGRIALHIWKDMLLAAPVFDHRTFVYTLKGEFVNSFKNPAINYKLLKYKEARRRGISFYSPYESQSGAALGIGDNLIIKSYQVLLAEKRFEYYLDIFDKEGRVLKSQIPIEGTVMSASEDGRLYAVSYEPYPRVLVYQLNLEFIK